MNVLRIRCTNSLTTSLWRIKNWVRHVPQGIYRTTTYYIHCLLATRPPLRRPAVRPAGLELEANVPLRMRCTTALSPMPSFTDAFLTFLPLLVQYRYNNGSNLKVFCGNRPDGEEQGWTWTRKIKCTGLEII